MWKKVSIQGLGSGDKILTAAQDLLANSGKPTIDQDLLWLRSVAEKPGMKVVICYYEHSDKILATVPIVIHESVLSFAFGEISFLKYPIERYGIVAQVPGLEKLEIANGEQILGEFFDFLAKEVKGRRAIFLDGVPCDGLLYKSIVKSSLVSSRFEIVPHGRSYPCRLIDLPESYEAYVSKLGSGTRQDLKRTRKRFLAKVNDDYRLKAFTDPSDVNAFLNDAEQISKKTYQWKALGLRIGTGVSSPEQLHLSAKAGWFRSYILYAQNEPIAFQLGYLYQNTYLAHSIGYDPEWGKYQVGIFLHTELIDDLIKSNLCRVFDFRVGDNLHKQRLSSSARMEQHFYLLPKTLVGFIVSQALKMSNGLSYRIGRLLDDLELKHKLKKIIRRKLAT